MIHFDENNKPFKYWKVPTKISWGILAVCIVLLPVMLIIALGAICLAGIQKLAHH